MEDLDKFMAEQIKKLKDIKTSLNTEDSLKVKICDNCGGQADQTFDGWWCKMCHNSMAHVNN
jgi:uncharacterized protein YukE